MGYHTLQRNRELSLSLSKQTKYRDEQHGYVPDASNRAIGKTNARRALDLKLNRQQAGLSLSQTRRVRRANGEGSVIHRRLLADQGASWEVKELESNAEMRQAWARRGQRRGSTGKSIRRHIIPFSLHMKKAQSSTVPLLVTAALPVQMQLRLPAEEVSCQKPEEALPPSYAAWWFLLVYP